MSDESIQAPSTGTERPGPEQLDAQGLKCPEPLMLVRNKIRSMPAGAELRVLATDPTTTVDLEKFCRFMKHDLVSSAENAGVLEYLIRKGGG